MGGDVTALELRTQFGTPAEICSCSGFQICDYSGTAGAARIDEQIRVSLQIVRLQHRDRVEPALCCSSVWVSRRCGSQGRNGHRRVRCPKHA